MQQNHTNLSTWRRYANRSEKIRKIWINVSLAHRCSWQWRRHCNTPPHCKNTQPSFPLPHPNAHVLTWRRYANKPAKTWQTWIDGWQRCRRQQRQQCCRRRCHTPHHHYRTNHPSPLPHLHTKHQQARPMIAELPTGLHHTPCYWGWWQRHCLHHPPKPRTNQNPFPPLQNMTPTFCTKQTRTRKPFDLDALRRQVTRNMQEADRLYPLLEATIQQLFPPPQTASQNHPTSHGNTLTNTDNLTHPPASPEHSTTHLAQPTLSMTERMLLNNTRGQDNFWSPDALHRRHTSHWIRDQQQLPAHNSAACMPGTSPILATAPPSDINTPAANLGIFSSNPILYTHVTWLAACQSHPQHPIQIPLATTHMVLDHDLWPP